MSAAKRKRARHNAFSLRDEFACSALIAYCGSSRIVDKAIDDWQGSGGLRPICIAEFLAGLSYEAADAMLEARKAPPKPQRKAR